MSNLVCSSFWVCKIILLFAFWISFYLRSFAIFNSVSSFWLSSFLSWFSADWCFCSINFNSDCIFDWDSLNCSCLAFSTFWDTSFSSFYMNSFSSWFIWCFIPLSFLEKASCSYCFTWVEIEDLYSTSCSFVCCSRVCSLALIDSLFSWMSYSFLFLTSLSNNTCMSCSLALISSSYFCFSLFSRRFKVLSCLDRSSTRYFLDYSSASLVSCSFFLCTSSASF